MTTTREFEPLLLEAVARHAGYKLKIPVHSSQVIQHLRDVTGDVSLKSKVQRAFSELKKKGLLGSHKEGGTQKRGLWVVTKKGLGSIKEKKPIHPYHRDAYLKWLAIENTPCFGHWSSRSESCSSCLVWVWCKQGVHIVLRETAHELEQRCAKPSASSDLEEAENELRAAIRKDHVIVEIVAPTTCQNCCLPINTGEQGVEMEGHFLFWHLSCFEDLYGISPPPHSGAGSRHFLGSAQTRAAVSQKVRILTPAYGDNTVLSQMGVLSSWSLSENKTVEPIRGIGFGDHES